jgi:hypothetical protein
LARSVSHTRLTSFSMKKKQGWRWKEKTSSFVKFIRSNSNSSSSSSSSSSSNSNSESIIMSIAFVWLFWHECVIEKTHSKFKKRDFQRGDQWFIFNSKQTLWFRPK